MADSLSVRDAARLLKSLFGVRSCYNIKDLRGNMKDLRGVCHLCPYYYDFQNFCAFYNILLNGLGFEPTCNNTERIIEEEQL